MILYASVVTLVLFYFLELSVAAKFRYAACEVLSNPSKPESKVSGLAVFRQRETGGVTEYKLSLTGFNSEDDVLLHGFHVHTLGTIKSGCEAAGGHFNPKGAKHGAPENGKRKRHVGDLGNVIEDIDGNVHAYGADKFISLRKKFNILGRALMVRDFKCIKSHLDVQVAMALANALIHAGEDDLGLGNDTGSMTTGNAGPRLACCTIAVSDETTWDQLRSEDK